MPARPLRIAILAILAFAAGLLIARLVYTPPAPPPTTERATILPEPRGLPELALTGMDGQPLPRDFFAGHWTIVFFGFTQCPDVCPTTLATLAQAEKLLADLPGPQQPRVLLVSVDPERDDPAKLAAYVRFFNPAFLAATASGDDLTRATEAFGVPFMKLPLPDGGYTFDHGAGLFVVDPSGGIAAYSSPPHQPATVAANYRQIVEYHESSR
jgi:protein SCO1/2